MQKKNLFSTINGNINISMYLYRMSSKYIKFLCEITLLNCIIFWNFELLTQWETLTSSWVVTERENVYWDNQYGMRHLPQNRSTWEKEKSISKNSPQELKMLSFLSPNKYSGKIIPVRELERTFDDPFQNTVLEEWESYAVARR